MITANSNAQIKYLIKLQQKSRFRNDEGVFVSEGRKLFEEIKAYGRKSIIKTYAAEHFFKEAGEGYFEGFDYEVVKDSVFDDISDTVTPQGIIALVRQPVYTLEDMLSAKRVRLLILENLRDPGNLGTIIRTAEGAGMNGIVMSRETVDIYNPKVIRSTMGAIFRVPFIYTEDIKKTAEFLKQQDVMLYAAHLEGAVDYDKAGYSGKSAVMIGNEAQGLTRELTALADKCVKIPMSGKLESLNAAVAAALLMYELRRTN